jgi:putative transposase
MPQSLASIHLHLVFSTKNRQPWLTGPIAQQTYGYMGGTLRGNKCALLGAGGMPDHIHLLISLGREWITSAIVRLVKSNSSRWIHDTFPQLQLFAWQAGYGAFAVSFSKIPNVRAYIANQVNHHTNETFQDEFRDFLRKHEIEWDERYVWD